METAIADPQVQDTRSGKSSIVGQEWRPGNYDLRDTWIPVAHSPHVTGKPIRRMVHSHPVFLWRDGGRPLAAEFHPDALGSGQCRGGELTGGSGYFPVHERYNYVWMWYGNPDNAHEALIPDVPYLPRAGKPLPRNMWGQIYFNCSYELVQENLLDLVHADYLHSDIIGDEENDDDRVYVESDSETVTMIREVSNKTIPPLLRFLGVPAKKADYRAVAHVHLRSGVVVLYGKFMPGFAQPLFHPLVPESRYVSRNNFTFNITGASPIARHGFPLLSYVIGPQDDFMMKPQNPKYQARGERRDVSSRFDAADSRYRMVMAKLIQRQKEGDYSYLSDADPGQDIAGLLDCPRVD
jgi:hypothetical protein